MSRRDESRIEAWIDVARRGGEPAEVRRAEMLCASHRDAAITRTLMDDFDRARAPRDGDAPSVDAAVSGALAKLRAARSDAFAEEKSGARLSGPRVAAAIATPGPQPAIHVVRRPAPPPVARPLGWVAVAAGVLVGIAIGAGTVAGGGVIVGSIARERAEEETARAPVAAIAPAPAVVVTPVPAPPPPFAAAIAELDPGTARTRAARTVAVAREALERGDHEAAERALRALVRRQPRSIEAGQARLALAAIYAETDREREETVVLERWLRTHRRDARAAEIAARIDALRE